MVDMPNHAYVKGWLRLNFFLQLLLLLIFLLSSHVLISGLLRLYDYIEAAFDIIYDFKNLLFFLFLGFLLCFFVLFYFLLFLFCLGFPLLFRIFRNSKNLCKLFSALLRDFKVFFEIFFFFFFPHPVFFFILKL